MALSLHANSTASQERPSLSPSTPSALKPFGSSPPASLELLQSHYGDVSRSSVTGGRVRQGLRTPSPTPLCPGEETQPAASAGGPPSPSEGAPSLTQG